MLSPVWRVSAPQFDVDSFLREFDITPDHVRHQSELSRRRRVVEESGFSLNLSDPTDEDNENLLSIVRDFIGEYRLALQALQALGVVNWIDIGFTVGSEQHFTRSLRFGPEDLALLAEVGISLEVSAYPSGED